MIDSFIIVNKNSEMTSQAKQQLHFTFFTRLLQELFTIQISWYHFKYHLLASCNVTKYLQVWKQSSLNKNRVNLLQKGLKDRLQEVFDYTNHITEKKKKSQQSKVNFNLTPKEDVSVQVHGGPGSVLGHSMPVVDVVGDVLNPTFIQQLLVSRVGA